MNNLVDGPSLDIVIEITKDAIAGVDNTLNAQDTKGLFVAGSATAIVALVAPNLTQCPILVCWAYAIAYFAVLGVSLVAYHPRSFCLPTADPNVAKDNFLQLTENETKQRLLLILQDIYKKQHLMMCEKGRWTKRSFYLLNLLSVFSLFLLFLPVISREDNNHGQSTKSTATKHTNTSKRAKQHAIYVATASKPSIRHPKIHRADNKERRPKYSVEK